MKKSIVFSHAWLTQHLTVYTMLPNMATRFKMVFILLYLNHWKISIYNVQHASLPLVCEDGGVMFNLNGKVKVTKAPPHL